MSLRSSGPRPVICLVPRARIELATQGFSVLRSTTELPRRVDLFFVVVSFAAGSADGGDPATNHQHGEEG